MFYSVFFFNDTATTEIYTYLHTLSLHDALPICAWMSWNVSPCTVASFSCRSSLPATRLMSGSPTIRRRRCARCCCRSEEHTSELQSLMRISYAVFCLKKKKKQTTLHTPQYHKVDIDRKGLYTTQSNKHIG